MAHWHDFNPWADCLTYITAEDADALLQGAYCDDAYWHCIVEEYGPRLDPYLLPQPNGRFSFGIRYGREPGEYLSPQCRPADAAAILAKHKGGE